MLQNYFVNFKMSFVQHIKYQTVTSQFRTIRTPICHVFEAGTSWG